MTKSSRPTTAARVISSPAFVARDIHFSLPSFRQLFIKIFPGKNQTPNDSFNSPINKEPKNMKKLIPLAILLVSAGAIILLSGKLLQGSAKNSPKAAETDQRTTIAGPRASAVVNKQMAFSISDDKGKEVTKLQYNIQSAEIRDEIVVKGTRAVAISGRTFLILNLKLVNSYDKAININARDYVRLVVNGNTNELIAADIHNDPVNVQAISTKDTRLGFPINESDLNNLSLRVGEIKGNKETISLKF
jgi:hypothetical protein